jgi:hypothetical protein
LRLAGGVSWTIGLSVAQKRTALSHYRDDSSWRDEVLGGGAGVVYREGNGKAQVSLATGVPRPTAGDISCTRPRPPTGPLPL